jgi:hypothetical protein
MYAGGRTSSSTPPGVANVESWNGSAWTEVNDLNQARYSTSSSGIQTNGLVFSGYQPPNNLSKTEAFDGTSFTEVGDLGTAVRDAQGANNPSQGISNALSFGGFSTAYSSVTETWTAPSVFTKITEGQLYFNSTTNTFKETISDAATGTWASVANLNAASSQGSTGAGKSNSAALEIGGYFNPPLQYYATVEQFDGSSWTEIADLNEGRSYGAGGGSVTSALIAGGTDGTNLATTESWDGSSWTETGDFNNARQVVAGAIPSNADGIAMGGYDGSYRAYVETWNGSTWTETTDLNAAAGYNTGSGTSTAALSFGGEPTPRDRVESWNGSSWTEVAEINTARAQGGSSGEGTNTSTIYFGGEPPQSAKTELWNGSSWTEIADLATARTGTGGAGVATSAIAIGGNPGSPPYALAEAFTAALTNKTITTS